MYISTRHTSRFDDLVAMIEADGTVPPSVGSEPTAVFLARFAGCSDIVPGALRDDVQTLFYNAFGYDCANAAVGTYARAARRIADIRRGSTDLVL